MFLAKIRGVMGCEVDLVDIEEEQDPQQLSLHPVDQNFCLDNLAFFFLFSVVVNNSPPNSLFSSLLSMIRTSQVTSYYFSHLDYFKIFRHSMLLIYFSFFSNKMSCRENPYFDFGTPHTLNDLSKLKRPTFGKHEEGIYPRQKSGDSAPGHFFPIGGL